MTSPEHRLTKAVDRLEATTQKLQAAYILANQPGQATHVLNLLDQSYEHLSNTIQDVLLTKASLCALYAAPPAGDAQDAN